MNDDCISKNEVIGTIEAFFCCRCPDFLRCDYKCEIADLMKEIKTMPNKGGKEPPRAYLTNVQMSIAGSSSAECSHCGAVIHTSFTQTVHYCPGCGAIFENNTNI